MAEQFYTILTKIGKAKIANATALGNKVNFTTLKVGDGKGKYYNPTEEQEDLVNEVWQGNINSIRVDESNPNWVTIEVIIPSSVGGFMIREAGVFDDENNMLAIGKYPETYKPQAQDGSTKDLVIRTNLEITNTSSVTLKVDPTVILATQKDIQVLNNKIENIKVPVTSVNEKTGAVVLSAEDIKTKDEQTVELKLTDISKDIGIEELKTNKKDLKGAVNELFTNANNLKKDWVEVIGNPLLSADTSAQLKNKTQEIKNNFVEKLISNNVEADYNESLQSLVDKMSLLLKVDTFTLFQKAIEFKDMSFGISIGRFIFVEDKWHNIKKCYEIQDTGDFKQISDLQYEKIKGIETRSYAKLGGYYYCNGKPNTGLYNTYISQFDSSMTLLKTIDVDVHGISGLSKLFITAVLNVFSDDNYIYAICSHMSDDMYIVKFNQFLELISYTRMNSFLDKNWYTIIGSKIYSAPADTVSIFNKNTVLEKTIKFDMGSLERDNLFNLKNDTRSTERTCMQVKDYTFRFSNTANSVCLYKMKL